MDEKGSVFLTISKANILKVNMFVKLHPAYLVI